MMLGLWFSLALGEPSAALVERWIRDAVAGRDALPALAGVQAAAVAALGLTDDEAASSWAARARWRGIVPRLDARLGTSQNVDVRSGADLGDLVTRDGRGLGVDFAARWDLGDLVFSDLEMRINRERIARSAAERLARERVTKVWFQRLEVLIRQRTSPEVDLALEAARLDGLLHALTAGRFRRGPRPNRARSAP